MQPQFTNRSIYSSQMTYLQNQQGFSLSALFPFCLEMLPVLLMCCFSLPNYNLCNFEGRWIVVAVGCNPDIFLRNLLDLSFSWQFSNVGDLLGICINASLFSNVLTWLHPRRWCLYPFILLVRILFHRWNSNVTKPSSFSKNIKNQTTWV